MAITINGTNGLTTDNGALKLDTDTLVVDDTNNRVGIGTSSPTGKLNVYSGDSGATTDGSADELFLEQAGNSGLTIGTPNTSTASIFFADPESSSAGRIQYLHTSNSLTFGTAEAERMRITATGNVGIGIASPQELLHLQKTGGSTMRFQNPGVRVWNIGNDSTSFVIDDVTATAERMRIDSSGTFFVGTTVSNASDGGIVISAIGTVCVGNSAGGSGFEFGTFRRSGSQIGSITQSGTTGVSYNTSSDYRLKENVVEITDGIDRVKLLNPSRFNFIADSDITVDGFLAHEVQEVVPEAIAGAKDATKEEEYEVTPAVLDDDGNVVTEAVMGTRTVPDYQGIDQSKLVPLLTAALQDSIAKIEALEARVTALENA